MYFFLGALSNNLRLLQSMILSLICKFYKQHKKTMSDFYLENNSKIKYNNPASQLNYSSYSGNNSQIKIGDNTLSQLSKLSTVQIGNKEYVPKIVESGYIVGPPVAYTNQANLPPNFNPFSPNSRSQSRIIYDSANPQTRDLSPHSRPTTPPKPIFAQPPPPHIMVSPPPQRPSMVRDNSQSHIRVESHIQQKQPSYIREETVSKVQYDRCVSECKNWETKYNELYLKYMNQIGQNSEEEIERLKEENFRLRQRVRDAEARDKSGEGSSANIKELIEKYKESSLKEVYLLLDRFRLECKQQR